MLGKELIKEETVVILLCDICYVVDSWLIMDLCIVVTKGRENNRIREVGSHVVSDLREYICYIFVGLLSLLVRVLLIFIQCDGMADRISIQENYL